MEKRVLGRLFNKLHLSERKKMAIDHIMKENIFPIKRMLSSGTKILRNWVASALPLHACSQSYPFHFHLHFNLASSFPLTLGCGNNKGEIRHCSCFLNCTSFFWIYCQDLFFGRNNKEGGAGTQLQVCSYSPHHCFMWGWREIWEGLNCAWQARGSLISPWGMLEGSSSAAAPSDTVFLLISGLGSFILQLIHTSGLFSFSFLCIWCRKSQHEQTNLKSKPSQLQKETRIRVWCFH